jgi:hypothetical protein
MGRKGERTKDSEEAHPFELGNGKTLLHLNGTLRF